MLDINPGEIDRFCVPEAATNENLCTTPSGGYVRASTMDRSHTK